MQLHTLSPTSIFSTLVTIDVDLCLVHSMCVFMSCSCKYSTNFGLLGLSEENS
jgi:Na+-transporting NADH:ubiquinone oxidoreductase subunit NqrE